MGPMSFLRSPEGLVALIGLAFLFIGSLILATWGIVIVRLLESRPILPRTPLVTRRPAPWGIGSIILTAVAYLAINQIVVLIYAIETGRFRVKQKPPIPGTAVAASDAPTFLPSEMMALIVEIDLALLVVVPPLLRWTCGARLRDFGVSFEGWWRQAGLGCAASLAAAPIVYSIQFSALKVFENHEHPVQKMLMKEYSTGVAQLAILSAVIAAPLFEELLFRGIIQSWLMRLMERRARARAIQQRQEETAQAMSDPHQFPADDPAIIFWEADTTESTSVPEPEMVPPDSKPAPFPAWPAIVTTSLLFAVVHGPQWPAPIGLFVLSLVIGTVYHRTGSLIAAICMHATFNGISTLMLIGAVTASEASEHKKRAMASPVPATIHSIRAQPVPQLDSSTQ
jgi:membrane protease YdiL (CAAX protease family)